MGVLSLPFDSIFSLSDLAHDLGAPANRLNNVHARYFHGDGSNLTDTVDTTEDYFWEGIHEFDQITQFNDDMLLAGNKVVWDKSNGAGSSDWVMDVDGIVEQRNAGFEQRMRWFNTGYTLSNNEYLELGFDTNMAYLRTATNGTGVSRPLTLDGGGTLNLNANVVALATTGGIGISATALGLSPIGGATLGLELLPFPAVYATTYYGDGSNLTGIDSDNIDLTADYDWTGAHSFGSVRTYNYTDGVNYVGLELEYESGVGYLRTIAEGTGVHSPLAVESDDLRIRTTSNLTTWRFNSAGLMYPNLTDTYDIGSASKTVRRVYATQFYGDGSNLTGVSVDLTADYSWTGTNTFTDVRLNNGDLRVYNGYIDGSNHDVLELSFSADVAYLRSRGVGTGTTRELAIVCDDSVLGLQSDDIRFRNASAVTQWRFNSVGVFYPNVTDTYDIGSTSRVVKRVYATELRTIRNDNASRYINITGNVIGCYGGNLTIFANTTNDVVIQQESTARWRFYDGGKLSPYQDNQHFGRIDFTINPNVYAAEVRVRDSFSLYNMYISDTNYERGLLSWDSNTLKLSTEEAGTGVSRPLELSGAGVTVKVGTGSGGTAVTTLDDFIIDSNSVSVGMSIIGITDGTVRLGFGDTVDTYNGGFKYENATGLLSYFAGNAVGMTQNATDIDISIPVTSTDTITATEFYGSLLESASGPLTVRAAVGQKIGFATEGSTRWRFEGSGILVPVANGYDIGLANMTINPDVYANDLGVKGNSYFYNTYTDASNYESLEIFFSGDNAHIRTAADGTGTARNLYVRSGGSALYLGANNSTRFVVSTTSFSPQSDGLYDIGSDSYRFRLGYFDDLRTNNMVTAGELSIYNVTGTNFERFFVDWDTSVCAIGTEFGGTGVGRTMNLQCYGSNMGFAIDGTRRVNLTTDDYSPHTTLAMDLGDTTHVWNKLYVKDIIAETTTFGDASTPGEFVIYSPDGTAHTFTVSNGGVLSAPAP